MSKVVGARKDFCVNLAFFGFFRQFLKICRLGLGFCLFWLERDWLVFGGDVEHEDELFDELDELLYAFDVCVFASGLVENAGFLD